MKQNKQRGIETIALFTLGSLLGFGLMGFILSTINKNDIARLEHYDTCFERLLTETTYDVNETQERSNWLKECMNK